MNMELLEQQLQELPLYGYFFIDPRDLEFNDRIRWICEHECPMYGKTWACPPGVGTVGQCRGKCMSYQNCLMIATVTEVEDISDRERAGEYLMLRLRTASGIGREEYERQYLLPFDPLEQYLERCLDRGHAEYNAETGHWHLTPAGFLLSNSIISDLLVLQDQSNPLARR